MTGVLLSRIKLSTVHLTDVDVPAGMIVPTLFTFTTVNSFELSSASSASNLHNSASDSCLNQDFSILL